MCNLHCSRRPNIRFPEKTKDGGLSDKTNPTKHGIGWSKAGLVKYNELYDFGGGRSRVAGQFSITNC